MRKEDNKRQRDRETAKSAAKAPPASVIRRCQHRQEKDGPICGTKFLAMPRIGKNDGVNHGVSPEQIYCPEHQKPKAVARRRWLNRNVENYRRLQRNYRHRNLPTVRKKQRLAAERKRERIATILAGRPADWWDRKIGWRVIGDVLLSRKGPMTNEELGRALDGSKMKCPYKVEGVEVDWETAVARSQLAKNYIGDIRTWVGRPGKTTRKKKP